MRLRAHLLVLASFLIVPMVSANDWLSWRGPENNGISREKNLPDKLDQVLWKKGPKEGIGCRSTPLVMNGRVYIINNVGEGINEQERVMCMDAKTGKVLWEHRFPVFFTPIVSVRLGWTVLSGDPETEYVYAHGTQGLFFCFDKNGKVIWSRSLTEEYGRISGYGGRVTSPVIEGDMVIIGMLNASWGKNWGGQTRFVAFDKKTGKVKWWAGTGIRPKNSYNCTPIVATINGERVLLSGGGDGCVHAFNAYTGKKLWSYEYGVGAMNPSPVVMGNYVYAAHGEENPDTSRLGKIVCLDASKLVDGKPKKVWSVIGYKFKYCSPLLLDGRVIIPDERGFLFCFDAKTGKRIWRKKYGRAAKGSPTYGDGKIYISSVYGKFHILKPGEKKCEVVDSKMYLSANPAFDVEVNGTAAISNGCVYFGTSEEFYCIGKYQETKVKVPQEEMPGKPEAGAEPAHLLVYPADVCVNPGETAQFKAHLYDAKGRFLREAKDVKWSLAPMAPQPRVTAKWPTLQGKVTVGGQFTAPKGIQGQFGNVVATLGELKGAARVRQMITLPYKEDFEDVKPTHVPGSWINAQLKYVVRKVGDNNVIVKTAKIPSPIVSRSRTYCGDPSLSDYTIQVDVQGQEVDSTLPDMGVMNSRYTLELDGETQLLRINAWDAIPRVNKTVKFPWKAGVWYTLKFKVSKGKLYGKAWEKSKDEPKDWLIELTDPNPTNNGAPGLYGLAKSIAPPKQGTEIYYDNLVITKN